MSGLTFWFEFASPYSYLSAYRIERLCQGQDVALRWQPFLLGPLFQAQGWATSPFNIYPAKGRYMWQDMDRQCRKYGLPPLVQPDPFPQNGLLAARIALMGARSAWIGDFVRHVYTAQFAQGQNISAAPVLGQILDQLGLDSAALLHRAKCDQTIKDDLRAATSRAADLGLFGAPSFVTGDGSLFWGDDRLEDAVSWAG